MTLLSTKGTRPDGSLDDLPIGGTAYTTSTPLTAGSSVNTGWINTKGYGSLLYVIRSDQISAVGGITVEYSDDGTNPIPGGGAISYEADQVNMQIQRALVPKGTYTRITYKNGATAQGSFRLEVKLSTTLIQPTEGSLNLPMTNSALGMYIIADEQLYDGTSYDRIGRIGDAKKVHVVNPSNVTVDTSSLSTSANQTNGGQKTQIVNGNNTTIGTQSNPLRTDPTGSTTQPVSGTVTVSNPTPSTDVSLLAKDTTLKDGSSKTQVTNFPATQPVTGTVAISNPTPSTDVSALAKDATLKDGSTKTQVTNFPATQPISGTVAVSNLPASQAQPSTANVTTVNTTAASTTIVPANANRKGLVINSTTGTILIKEGPNASATSYTYRIITNGMVEFPKPVYTGLVSAIGAGTIIITEET